MRIFLLRHGIAANVSASGPRTDEERPLTAEGRELMQAACKHYARHVAIPDRIISSPLLRARQTAKILSQAVNFQGVVEQVAELEPGARPTTILNSLQGDALEGRESVVLVGHERAFGTQKGRPQHLRTMSLVMGDAWRAALTSLTDDVLEQALGDVLDKRRRRALLARRDKLIE